MKRYRTTQILNLHSGRIGLNKNQAGSRALALKIVANEKDFIVCEITGEVQFKAGEVLWVDKLNYAGPCCPNCGHPVGLVASS